MVIVLSNVYCTVLLANVLYCTVLLANVFYCTLLLANVLYCTVLLDNVLYCTVLLANVVYCTVLLAYVLYCTELASNQIKFAIFLNTVLAFKVQSRKNTSSKLFDVAKERETKNYIYLAKGIFRSGGGGEKVCVKIYFL